MPETFDPQRAFDELTRQVAREVGPGDVGLPIRAARRRRMVGGVAAVAVASVLAVTLGQVVGTDSRSSTPEYAETNTDTSQGAARRERLLTMLPEDTVQAHVLDVGGVAGFVADDDQFSRIAGEYVLGAFATLGTGPILPLLPDLVTYAGDGGTSVFLLDLPANEVTDGFMAAGWEEDGELLVPGPAVGIQDASTARNVHVADDGGGRSLVAIAGDPEELPDIAGTSSRTPSVAVERLLGLEGPAGFALSFEPDPCAFVAATLTAPTEATMLVAPPAGRSADAVTVDDLTPPKGVVSIDAAAADGNLVRVELTVEQASVPADLLDRYPLPGTQFC